LVISAVALPARSAIREVTRNRINLRDRRGYFNIWKRLLNWSVHTGTLVRGAIGVLSAAFSVCWRNAAFRVTSTHSEGAPNSGTLG
jgi:hypothetical protein